MANDKKFIVKNGLLTPQNVVIGSNSDTGEKLQVTGTSKLAGQVTITNSDFSSASLSVTNSAGYLFNPTIAEFKGDSDSLQITNIGVGDYKLVNSQQNNGIIFYDSTPGVRILYNNAARLDINSAGNRFYGLSTTTIDNNRILTVADEGSGNGLDADTVDGLEANQFVRSDVDDIMAGNYTIQQDLVVSGNLTVSGTTTTINTEEILLADNIITLNSNYTGSTPTENAGIEIERGTLDNPKILWDETSDYWKLVSGNLTDLGRIITTADEGSGNGFDADTVDGLEASQFLRSDIDDTANGNITILGDLTLGDNVGGAQINFDGVGNNRTLYSESGVIGFLNQAFNYAARSTADGDWIVERDVQADRNLIAETNITANAGDITATAGNVIAGDSITAQNNITATTGNIAASAGSVSAATTVTAGTDVIGQRFVDADNNSYVVNPAGTSTMNDIGIDDDLFHNGDTNTKISFGTDDISLQTGGAERLGIDNDSVDATVTFTAPSVGIDTDLFHNGDTDTKISFTTDEIDINTGGATRLTANTTGIHVTNLTASGNVSAAIEVESPIYYDKDDRTYYGDFASTSRINDIALVGQIIHDGDTNTFLDFNAADSFQVVAGGTGIFTATSTTVTVDGDLTVTGTITGGDANFTGDVSANNITATTAMYSPIYYDADNNGYYGDFAGTSVFNRISIDDYVVHNGDTNTYIGFSAADTFDVVTGGTTRLTVDTTYVTSTLDGIFPNLFALRYYDAENATYYTEPAATSRMNDISLVGEIIHDGDTDTYLQFHNENEFRVVTGGAERLEVTNAFVRANNQMRSPIYYDNDNTAYYGNFASTSNMNRIDIDDYIRHRGDTDTYMGFDAADTWGVWTNGTRRLTSNATAFTSGLEVRAPRFVDSDNNNYYVDPANASLSATLNGAVRIGSIANNTRWSDNSGNGGISLLSYGDDTATSNPSIAVSGNYAGAYALLYLNRIDPNPNPFNNGNRYIEFSHDGTAGGTIRGDGSGNLYQILAAGTNWGFWTSAASEALIVDDNGNVMITAGASPTYTDGGDNTPLVGTNNPAKLHVGGSIYLNNNDDAIIFGRGAASFLKDEELAFGWGSGWYMTDASYLRVRNNTAVYSTGDYYGSRFYAEGATAYYLDPNGDSQLNTIDIDDYIRHRGDTNTYFGFAANDTFRVWTNAVQRLNIDNDSADFAVNVYAPRYYDSNNVAYYGDFASTSQMNRIDIDDYIRHRGDTDNYIGFPSNDSQTFVTGGTERLEIDNSGVTSSVAFDSTVSVSAPIYYDTTGTTYYLDLASGSLLRGRVSVTGGHGSSSFRTYLDPTENGAGTGISTLQMWNSEPGNTWDWGGFGFNVDNSLNEAGNVPAYYFGRPNPNLGQAYMRFSSDGNWYFYNNPNGTNTLYTTMRLDRTGYVFAPQSVRSPIFYDSNDTGYYVDPASNTRLNTIQALRYYFNHNTTYYMDQASGNYGSVKTGGATGGWSGYAIEDWWVFMANNASTAGIYNDSDNEWAVLARRNAEVELYYNGVVQAETQNGYFLANNQMRSPIFYDSDNTAYFVNPDSTTNIRYLKVNTTGTSSGTRALTIKSDGQGETNFGAYPASWTSALQIQNNNNTDMIWISPLDDGYSGRFRMAGAGLDFYTDGTVVDTGTHSAFIGSGYIQGISSIRGPIFYDSNDTNYYVDPANISHIRHLEVAAVTNSASYQHAAIEVREFNYGGAQADTYAIAPRIGFHWGSRVASQIALASNGEIRILNNPGTATENFRASIGYFDASARSPIFYDLNDTNYYADPNGTTRFYEQRNVYRLHIGDETNLYNGIYVGTPINRPDLTIKGQYPQLNIMSTKISNTTHGGTLRFAAYDTANASSGNFKHWVIGIAGTNATALHFGYSPNQTNPHYGIGRGWSSGNNVSMFWLQNDRNVYAENDVRALRFVDRDSTGYYMDPSNLSELYDVRQRGWYTRTYAHSGSDFVNGTLVQTSIPATATNGASFVLEASGKSYSGDPPFKFTAQGYLYANTIINYSGQNIGKAGFTTMYIFQYNGVLCFWWPRVSYWNSFAVHVRDAGGDDRNLVTSITNSVIPGGRTKEVQVTMRTTAMYNVNLNTGDMYATRYYDSNNTAYYGDFASTSRMNTIDVDRINFVGGAPAYFYTSSGALRGYIRATETNDSHFEFATSSGEDIIFRDAGFGGTWNQIIRGNGQVLISSRLDVPIMYDLDDTGYYVNPAATTQLSYVLANNWFRAQGSTGFYFESYGRGMWAPEAGGNAYGTVTTNGGGRNGWQGWGIGSRHVFMSTGGDNVGIHDNSRGWIMYWNGSRTRFDHGYTEAAGSFRAPIFYDVNDTGYYGDFASTNRFNQTEHVGRMWYSNYLVSRNQGGLMGDYNSSGTATKVIWTIGESWPLANMYGLAYDYGSGYGHHLALRNNGTTYSRFGFAGGMLLSGTGTASGDFRAPIFYDSNNTAYYFDGASINSTRFEGVSNRTKAHMAISGQTRSSAEYYMARPRITGDQNYWTGSMGWGQIDMNTVADWGSGFIDSWSNPANQPAGTSHWVGTQAYHYSNGGARYGWQMVGGPIAGLWFRNTWSSFSGWRKIAMYGLNEYSGDFFASRYYDSNNTGYYVDPASTSEMVHLGLQGYLHVSKNNATGQGIIFADDGDIADLNDAYCSMRFSFGVRIFSANRGGAVRHTLHADGNSYSTTSKRAPIFYDSIDTGYYFDGASTSRWNESNQNGYHTFNNYGLGVTGTYSASRLQLVFAMGSAYRPNSAGTSTANMYGIGWSHPNAGGLGGANQLNDHGMLIINNGGFRAAISSRAVFSADVRTPIYYDWNDTGYYLDPNSTSNSALRIRGGALYGPNPSWGRYLYVGTNGNVSSEACVATTNGNLHLDSRAGADLYLQWYVGRTVFVQGAIQATIYYDRNSTGYYTDPASTSRLNEVVLNDGVRLRSPNGGYGSFAVTGAARSGYEGFSINDRVVMMHNNGGVAGMYNDANDEWLMRFDLNSFCILYHNGAEKLRTRTDGIQAQAFFYSSDERLKENIVTIENAVDKVKALRGVEYNWKDGGQRDIGLIAQEVQEVIPEVVRVQDTSDPATDVKGRKNDKDKLEDVLSVEYGHIVGLLVEATKEQQRQIENQNSRIEQLKKMVDKLLKG